MKAIRAYVNGETLHVLITELQNLGAQDFDVIEHYSAVRKISRIKFLCDDCAVEKVRSVISSIGSTGTACDSCFQVADYLRSTQTPASNFYRNGEAL